MEPKNGSDMYTQGGDGHVEENIMDIPQEALQAIDEDSIDAGGAYTPPPGYEGSVGRTMFDTPTSKDGTLTVLLPPENIDVFPSQALVRIKSLADSRVYLGAVAEGPFAEPDGLRADATPMVVSTVQGGLLMPKYHGRVQVEIIGEQIDNGTLLPPSRRPKPNSPVFTLNRDETAKALSIQGSLRLGLADGFDDLGVCVPANSKGIFPRHLGILGTTGGGKSTTVSGLIAKAQSENMAIVLVDTEGEYCGMDKPTEDEPMIQALKRQEIEPKGVDDTHIYHLVDRETANPNHPDVKQFSLRFSALSPYALQEILDLTEAQSERFFKAYDVTKRILEKLKIWPANEQQRQELLELDEMDGGYPKMTLTCLYDVVKEIHAFKDKDAAEPNLETYFLQDQKNRDQLKQLISTANMPGSLPSWRALMGKLNKIKRLKIFDSKEGALQINYKEMLQPGRVNILDLSDTDSPQINNLVIAEILRGVQMQQEINYKQAADRKEQPTPTTIFIEEAHEFLSAQRIQKMQVLFQQVARIARRGRKRWLGLVFITQLPQHLPDEVLGLINNWILHKVSDATVVSRLKRSIGGINEGLWRQLPSLAPGQAIGSFTTFTRPLLIGIDPTPCKLLMVD